MSEVDKMTQKAEDKLTLSLRWGSHRETVLQSLESSYGDQDFVDMTLACEGQSVKAHKVVVSACSTHLKQLLMENPCPHPIVILKDVAMKELRRLLEFMYCGRVTVEQQQLEPLLEAAKMLGVRGLAASRECLEESEEQEGESSECDHNRDFDYNGPKTMKRHRSESPTPNKKTRPVPQLQSILAQTLLTSPSTRPGENASDLQSESLKPSSPISTLAKLLSQSPVSTLGSSHSSSLENESNRTESNTPRPEDANSISSQMMEVGLQLKQESVDLDLDIDNPTEALELEYQNPEFDETVDTDTYQNQAGHPSSSAYDSSVHERIGKATAFMLSLAKRANQNNPFTSSPPERKLSFHEPRPCSVCNKMYRDAATLRTHMAMMHPTARMSTPSLPSVVSAGEATRSAPLSAAEYLASMAENLKSDSQWRRWQ
ncbi:protein bric-a-brac 2-like isoform X3 [Thrips palmi]|uniref:Protein bric-a-brac 2-like isoform X3 n=1 Tax=Thrips palmi TaxID=161013 RepID=A0A6P8YVG4_THRPL|nr:protein bric-a-brac 2-like isoform X3 [Thrips palmi]